MMGQHKSDPQLFNYAVNLEKRVRAHPPLRQVKAATANADELEMDSPAPRNGVMDACLQSSSPIKRLALCQK